MRDFDYRFGLFAIASGAIALFLFVADLVVTPSVFENAYYELAFATPLVFWLTGRRVFHWADRHR